MLLQNIFGPLRSKYLVAQQQLCLHRGFALIPTSSEKAEAAVVNRKLQSAYNREMIDILHFLCFNNLQLKCVKKA